MNDNKTTSGVIVGGGSLAVLAFLFLFSWVWMNSSINITQVELQARQEQRSVAASGGNSPPQAPPFADVQETTLTQADQQTYINALEVSDIPEAETVRDGTHSILHHQADALTVRCVMRACTLEDLLVLYCPAMNGRPARFAYVCKETGGSRCAYWLVGIDGYEITGFITGCYYTDVLRDRDKCRPTTTYQH